MPPMSFVGVVTKAGFMNKTATVTVSRWVIDKRTGKRISRDKKFLVHDERNRASSPTRCERSPSSKALILTHSSFVELRTEDSVLIRNCPPISARKRFTLEKIVRSPETERAFAHPTAPPVASPTPVP
ncbi:hypothetical protein EDB87DRAFT_1604911 [Lactarius vividus]|nr:hypothetical protein EDB87DRAFT_1604911 [Lactarius vividus]